MALLGDIKGYLAERLTMHLTAQNRSRKALIKNKLTATNGGHVQQNIVILNEGGMTAPERAAVLRLLKEKFDNGEIAFIADQSKHLADTVSAAEKSDPVRGDLVHFFADKLKPQDWHILRTGLYINYLFSQGMPTAEIRGTIIQNHGDRGRNILNLASSGHFASHIKPLYQELAKSPEFTNEIFYQEFEIILQEMPFAIFVNSHTNSQALCKAVQEKIQQMQDYSVENKQIYIHAWGQHVSTVEMCLTALQLPFKISVNKRREAVEVIDVTIDIG